MSIDYTQSIENLFESINVIVSKKLEDVSFDTTIVCTVVDDTDRKNGKYQVTNGTTKFDAYADSSDYRTGDSVRVQVLNGDYSGKKYVVGKAVTNTDTTPLTYVSPIDTIVNITGNLVDDKGSITGLIANGSETSVNLWGADLSEHEIWTSGIYSALTIRADFRTLLDNYDLKAGSYGLRVHLFIKPSKESSYYVDNYFDLDSSEMFGNPYAFTVYTKQGKKVALTTSGIVQHIVLSAYQKADFVNRSGKAIGAATKENIFIKNIEIGFGSDLEKIDDNTVKIYTNSSTQYKYYQHTKETNLKTLGLLWYNKNDNNEYLGFSDGYYDPEYDELTYIAESAEDARRGAYMARDNMPSDIESLDLAANIDDAIPIFQAARKLVTGDLITQLRSYEDQLSGAGDAASLLTDYTKAGDGNTLIAAADGISKYEESLKSMYSAILSYWYAKSQDKAGTEPTNIDNYAGNILTWHRKIISDIKTLLSEVREAADSGYEGVCDNYEARINRVLSKIEDTLSDLPSGVLDGTDYPILEKWADKTNFKSYQRKDFSSYDNKYCVYWYRANKDKEADDVMSAGWERIEDLDNFGIPGKGEKVDGKVRNQTKLPAGENTTEHYMQYDLAKETFKAVVFYNHDKFISDELVFTNADDIPDKSTLDKSDALVIKHKNNSQDNYNCYAMTNYLLNAADSSIEREVECYYDGLLAKNEVLVNARAYWYVPEDSTMITANSNLLTKKGFVVDKSRPKQGYVCYYKKLTADVTEKDDGTKEYNFGESLSFWYRIKPYYEQSAVLNDIQCEVILANENDEDYIAGQLTLTFGQQSTSGTKYTMVIAPSTIQRGTTASDNYLMSLHLEDAEGELIPLSTESLPTEAKEVAYELKITPVMSRAVVKGDEATPSLSKKEDSAEADPWTLTAIKNNYGIYKASASIGINTTQKDENDDDKIVKTRYVDLIAWFSVPWSAGKNGDEDKPGYYLSGPTSIIYNNLGTLDNTAAYQTPYKLFNDNQEQIDVTWSLEYCKIDGKDENSDDIDLRYMPSLNADNTLSPASMYLNGLEYYPVLVAKQGTNVLWRQPIIIMQNQYASNMLNDWDGSFQIDEKNGTIMSSMIAAGRKNSNNTFEGVVMGCVAQNLEIDELNDSADGVGIYGFHDGAASFGVLADGTAFMGKAGNGRILINGNNGTIESAAYSQTKKNYTVDADGEKHYSTPAGMQVDLENGKLVMRSASLGSGENAEWAAAGIGDDGEALEAKETRFSATITLDSNVKNNSYLDITVPWHNDKKEWELKPLIHIGDTVKDGKIEHSYYLQSQNYKSGTYSWEDNKAHSTVGAGTLFNLVNGTIDAYNFKLQSKNVLIDSSEEADPYFVVKSDETEDSNGNTMGGRNLIYCGSKNYYLQSNNYSSTPGTSGDVTIPGAGMNISLNDGEIRAYNFLLDSANITIDSYDDDGYGLIRIEGTKSDYKISITNDPGKNPLEIGKYFSVDWSGKLSASNATIQGTITTDKLTASSGTIGNWKITNGNLQSSNGSVILNGSSGEISGSTISGSTISGSTVSGSTISGSTISGSTISGSTISGGQLNIGDGICEISEQGILTAAGAILSNLTVTSSLLVKSGVATSYLPGGDNVSSLVDQIVWDGGGGGGSSSSTGALCTISGTTKITGQTTVSNNLEIIASTKIGGHVGIGVSPSSNYLLYVNGKSYITGNVGIGAVPSEDYRVVIGGKTKIDSNLLFTGNIYCDSEDSDHKGQDLTTCYLMSTPFKGVALTFKKGILVNVVDYGFTSAPSNTSAQIPSYGSKNTLQYLRVKQDYSGLEWSSLPIASSNEYGTVKLGYTTSGKNYAVQSKDGKLYVNVPWTGGTTYLAPTSAGTAGYVWTSKSDGTAAWVGTSHTHTVRTIYKDDTTGALYATSATGRSALVLTAQSSKATF